jgi:polyphosphate kinase
MRRTLKRLIAREALRSTEERPGLIMAKMNSLADSEIIEALYEASRRGVRVLLNVRGICRLVPGVPGSSENIEVVSIVDMFLEHSRIFHFGNGGEEEVYLASADWMPRNLDRRIETMFPIEDPHIRREVVDLLRSYFEDNVKAWRLLPDGRYARVSEPDRTPFRVQEHLCRVAEEKAARKRRALPRTLRPQFPRHV